MERGLLPPARTRRRARILRPRSPTALLFVVATAWAAPATSTLSWVRLDGAESCVAAPELAAEVETRLGRAVFVPPADAVVAVEGHVEHTEGVWRGVLRMTDHGGTVLGERVVESRAATCEELGHVVAVTLALLIDPDPAPAEPAPPPPPALPPPPAPAWHTDVHAALTGGWGLVPGVTLGGSATVAVTPPRFVPVLATGELVPYGTDADGVVTFTRATGGLGLCPLAAAPGRLLLRACVGVDAGAIFVVASTEPLDADEWVLVEGRVSARGSWRVWGPLLVDLAVHGVVPFRAVTFRTDAGAEVYAPPPVAVLGDVGIGARF